MKTQSQTLIVFISCLNVLLVAGERVLLLERRVPDTRNFHDERFALKRLDEHRFDADRREPSDIRRLSEERSEDRRLERFDDTRRLNEDRRQERFDDTRRLNEDRRQERFDGDNRSSDDRRQERFDSSSEDRRQEQIDGDRQERFDGDRRSSEDRRQERFDEAHRLNEERFEDRRQERIENRRREDEWRRFGRVERWAWSPSAKATPMLELFSNSVPVVLGFAVSYKLLRY